MRSEDPSPEDVAWVFDPDVKPWRDAGIHTRGDAEAWQDLSVKPSDAAEWTVRGFTAETAAPWVAAHREPSTAEGLRSTFDQFIAAGYQPADAVSWMISTPGAPHRLHSFEVAQADRWRKAGFTPAAAHEWQAIQPGLEPADAKRLAGKGFDARTASDSRAVWLHQRR